MNTFTWYPKISSLVSNKKCPRDDNDYKGKRGPFQRTNIYPEVGRTSEVGKKNKKKKMGPSVEWQVLARVRMRISTIPPFVKGTLDDLKTLLFHTDALPQDQYGSIGTLQVSRSLHSVQQLYYKTIYTS